MIYCILLDKNKYTKMNVIKFIQANKIEPIRIKLDDLNYKIIVNNICKQDRKMLKMIEILDCMKIKYM
jgi:hypothetical protein